MARGRKPAAPASRLGAHLPAGARGKPALIVVFQPGDCESYRGFIEAMGSLTGRGHGAVLGAPVNAPSGERALRESFAGLAPDLVMVPGIAPDVVRMLGELGYHDTPVAVLVDPAGRPAMVVQPQPDPFRQARMADLVGAEMAMLQTRSEKQ